MRFLLEALKIALKRKDLRAVDGLLDDLASVAEQESEASLNMHLEAGRQRVKLLKVLKQRRMVVSP